MHKKADHLKMLALTGCFIAPLAIAQDTRVCTFPGEPRNPNSAYTVNNNGTVVDQRTGLMWDQCAWGQSGNDCSGSGTSYNWTQMRSIVDLANSQEHKGYNDWRMPNLAELKTLVESCRMRPAINVTVFPNTPSNWFWSVPAVMIDAEDTAGVYFFDGNGYGYGHRNNQGYGRVRLVRDLP